MKRILTYLKLKLNGCHAIQYWTDSDTPYFTFMDKDYHYQRIKLK